MKSFFFWIGGLLLGALAGYAIAVYFSVSLILAMSCGIIIGSTTAITINILRDDENNMPEQSSD